MQTLGIDAFDGAFVLRCRSKALGVAILSDELLLALSDVGVDLVDIVVRAMGARW